MKGVWILAQFISLSTIFMVLVEPGGTKMIRTRTRKYGEDAEEIGGYFEGDIVFSYEQMLDIVSKNVLRNLTRRWPNNTLVYQLSPRFSPRQKRYIRRGLDIISNVSCIKFRKKTYYDRDYVNVTAYRKGCYATLGYSPGVKKMNLAPDRLGVGCFRIGTIMHEFMHALGFLHQHSSYDRDNYITIKWENLEQRYERNFKKSTIKNVTQFYVEYDYDSVMHYNSRAFSSNGWPTIIPKWRGVEIGQRKKLSVGDIKKLNRMHHCRMK